MGHVLQVLPGREVKGRLAGAPQAGLHRHKLLPGASHLPAGLLSCPASQEPLSAISSHRLFLPRARGSAPARDALTPQAAWAGASPALPGRWS